MRPRIVAFLHESGTGRPPAAKASAGRARGARRLCGDVLGLYGGPMGRRKGAPDVGPPRRSSPSSSSNPGGPPRRGRFCTSNLCGPPVAPPRFPAADAGTPPRYRSHYAELAAGLGRYVIPGPRQGASTQPFGRPRAGHSSRGRRLSPRAPLVGGLRNHLTEIGGVGGRSAALCPRTMDLALMIREGQNSVGAKRPPPPSSGGASK
jgi:hypothetical protein